MDIDTDTHEAMKEAVNKLELRVLLKHFASLEVVEEDTPITEGGVAEVKPDDAPMGVV